MRYRSTRGAPDTPDFRQATLRGLAPDGGLYLPTHWPRFGPDDVRALAGLTYVQTAARVLAPFTAGVLSADELEGLCERAYGGFDHAAVTPLVQLDERHWLLELFHGPTLAFKDVAMQLLGLLFQRFLAGTERPLTVIGATSGDTGSAAIAALADRAGIDIVMLHPAGRVTDVQRRQMTTVMSRNVHNVAVDGTFDDAQALVKALFADPSLSALELSAVNSINWARLLPQIVYYVYAAVRLGAPERPVAFSVPSGNFGNVFAGYAASAMGLPIERLIVATNVNDILHRALSTGDYSAGPVTATTTPSMDIQLSSNFERLLHALSGGRSGELSAAMGAFAAERTLTIPAAWLNRARPLFASRRVDEPTVARTMADTLDECGQLLDPHTAVGLAAARDAAADLPRPVPVVTLATAHPAKFPDAVERATGVRPPMPPRLADLFEREERCVALPAEREAVARHILDVVAR